MYSILDKYGNKRCDVNSLEYRGEFMSVSSVVVTIKSNKPIEFANGDYIVFRGEEFTLRYTPAILKQARKDTYGEAFVYENMVFYAASDELTRCDFLDVVKSDNNIHYTSLPNFSFYAESVQELADRIQANLNRLYKGNKAWSVTVADGTTSKPHNFSCSNIKCWDALVLANTELDLNFVIRGRNIIIGDTGSVIDNNFAYGKNLGLKSINSTTSENSAIITRLRAYGSTRNIPYRYYNKLYINSSGVVKYFKEKPTSGWELLISESMYIPNLMLPMFRNNSLIGAEGNLYNEDGLLCGKYRLGGTIGEDAYIESVNGVEKYGVNEGTVFFDTEDEEDEDNIYPSMSGITAQDLINAGYSIQLDSGDNGNLDEILSAEVMTDDGYLPENGSSIDPSSFSVTLKDIGFDIEDYLLSGESAQIYFSSGELVGRTFEITAITKNGKKQILRLNRYLDEDIQWVFPNKYYNAKAGDKFVLLNIYMPDVYVAAAEFRLLERAKFYLADNDHNTINYTPSIDNIFLARNPEIAENIKEGNIFTFYDDDLGIHKSITISSIIIKIGESLIPEYEVTLSEDKDATLVDRITTEVSDNIGKTLLSSSNVVSLSRLQFDKRYLRKTTEDTAEKKITFASGLVANGDGVVATKVAAPVGKIKQLTSDEITTNHIESTDYLGDTSGFKLANIDGDSYLEVDKLSVRKKAIFTELDIKRIDHIGGATVTSPASCRIDKVLSYAGGYKCYFRAEDGDRAINNDWKIGDQAMCHAYNTTTPRYYWRLVIAVSAEIEDGYHWVTLSLSDCDADSDEPMADDTIVCFGNRTDTDRQAVILMNSEGVTSPCLQQLKGINSYVIADANIVTQLSPTKNIIRGEQIELSTSSGNKGVQQLADEALASAKGYTDTKATDANFLAMAISKGKLLYTDPTFKSGTNGISRYNNAQPRDSVTITRKQIDGIPNDSGYGLEIVTDTSIGTPTPGAGGFCFANRAAANKIFITRIIAKIPEGRHIEFTTNNVGVNSSRKWLTSNQGTGDWQEYIYYLKCGAESGATGFGYTNYYYILPAGDITWQLAYATVIEATGCEQFTTLTEFNTEINQLKDSIELKATKTEVQGKFDNLQVGQRNYAPNTSVAMTAYQFRDCYYPDNFRGKTAKITYRATYNITALPSGSYAGIQVHITYNDGTQSWIGAGVNNGITVGTATNKLIKKTIAVENKKVLRFRVYCQFKEGATGTFSIDQLMVNPDTFADWSPAPEDTADSIDKLGTRVTAAESNLTVQADRISSVVSKQEAMVVDYTFADFIVGDLAYEETHEGVVLGYNNDVHCHWLRIKDVKKGDVIRFETSDYSGVLVYSITGSDGDADGAEAALIRDQNPIVDQYTWLGKQLFDISHDDEEISETLIPMDCVEVYVYTSDDWYNKGKTKVTHIKAKMTAQSRIDQSADNIRLQVGEAGINLDTKVITLDASKTIVTGDLAVRTVKCYYDDAQTQLKSAYNGNGDGTIVYYYPTGKVMKEDTFVTDSDGNVIGMKTTYYKADGSVAWVISEGGLSMTLEDYWVPIAGGKEVAYTTDVDTMMSICVEHTADAMAHFTERSVFSKFVSKSVNYEKYNGKVTKGFRTSEAPTAVTLFAGVLVYSVELYKDGLLPTYTVTYEQVTTALGQISMIMTKKFNSFGEVN